MLDRFLTVNLNYKNHSPHLDLQKEVVTLNENVVKMSNPKTNSTAPSALNKFILSCHAKITKIKTVILSLIVSKKKDFLANQFHSHVCTQQVISLA